MYIKTLSSMQDRKLHQTNLDDVYCSNPRRSRCRGGRGRSRRRRSRRRSRRSRGRSRGLSNMVVVHVRSLLRCIRLYTR
eukprot:COSAG02_NODE_55876_length_288_cov_0.814815_1_plen_78_part_10